MKFVWFTLFALPALGQSLSFEKLNSNVEVSFRGLDVISKKIASTLELDINDPYVEVIEVKKNRECPWVADYCSDSCSD